MCSEAAMFIILILASALSLAQSASTTSSAGRVTGRVVVDGTNAPIAGARVTIFPSGPRSGPFGPPPQALTDEQGRFVLAGLEPGEYHIDVQKTGFAPLTPEIGADRRIQIAAEKGVDGI